MLHNLDEATFFRKWQFNPNCNDDYRMYTDRGVIPESMGVIFIRRKRNNWDKFKGDFAVDCTEHDSPFVTRFGVYPSLRAALRVSSVLNDGHTVAMVVILNDDVPNTNNVVRGD